MLFCRCNGKCCNALCNYRLICHRCTCRRSRASGGPRCRRRPTRLPTARTVGDARLLLRPPSWATPKRAAPGARSFPQGRRDVPPRPRRAQCHGVICVVANGLSVRRHAFPLSVGLSRRTRSRAHSAIRDLAAPLAATAARSSRALLSPCHRANNARRDREAERTSAAGRRRGAGRLPGVHRRARKKHLGSGLRQMRPPQKQRI